MDNITVQRLHAVVSGRVQGVGFRNYVLDKAGLLDLTGWVRNTYAGQVECIAEGERSQLDILVEYLQRGPRASFVSDLDIQWETATGEFSTFRVAPTY